MNTMPLEADTRLLIDRSLENLGWIFNGKEKNVFLEQPRTEEERQALEHKRPDYVLYSQDHKPLIVIEAKKKGERINTALEQGIFYAQRLKAPLVYATDGVFCKAFHVEANRPPLLNGNELDEFIRQALALRFIGNYEVNTISPKVQYDRKELIKIFDNANNMLRGDGLRAGIERFGEFANILFIKLLSEKGNIDDSCSWETIKKMPISTRISYINSTVYKTLNGIYNTEIFTPLTMQDNEILDEIMKSIDPLTLTDVDSDVKGDAFEYFLKASTASGNDLGEYFTPRHIVKTMVRLVNPQIGEKVYDPFCGTGGFLIESFRHIYNNMPRNEVTEKMLRENTIFGNEITNTARITKMNMILAGDGHSGIHKIDSLANPVKGKYDVVLANMPYSQKTKWGNLYDVPSKNGDSICVQHCIKAINSTSENGRMALVVPEGFLFRKDLKKTREYLLENSELQSVISLPQGVFLPYTGVKTDIIYATKVNQKIPTSKKRKNYWYFEVKNDGYSLDNYRRKLDTQSDLQKYEEYRKLDEEQKEEMQKIGFDIIPFDKVRENDFNFVGSRYKKLTSNNNRYQKVLLSYIAEIKTGNSAPQNPTAFIKGVYPFIRVSDLAQYHQTNNLLKVKDFVNEQTRANMYLFPKGTIIIPKSGASCLLNHRGIIGINACISSHLVGLICNKNLINNKFLYYYLCHLDSKNIVLNEGYPSIRKEDIENLLISLPPLEIQEKIVEELEYYQNIIDGAKQVIENYKPNFKILPQWDYKKLKDLCYLSAGGDVPQNRWSKIPTPHYNIPIYSNGTDEHSLYGYTDIAKVTQDAITISARGTIGHVQLRKAPFYPIVRLITAIPKTDIITLEFLYLILQKTKIQKNGNTIPQLTLPMIKEHSIPVPSLEEQKEIVNIIGREQELINSNKQLIEIFTQKIHDRINQLFEEK